MSGPDQSLVRVQRRESLDSDGDQEVGGSEPGGYRPPCCFIMDMWVPATLAKIPGSLI